MRIWEVEFEIDGSMFSDVFYFANTPTISDIVKAIRVHWELADTYYAEDYELITQAALSETYKEKLDKASAMSASYFQVVLTASIHCKIAGHELILNKAQKETI